jgi:hypothetical protein
MKKKVKLFIVHDIATFFASRDIKAETKKEALDKYFKNPCHISEFEYGSSEIDAEELKD